MSCTALSGRGRYERLEQLQGRFGDPVNGLVERLGMSARWHPVATDLPHKLQCGRADLLLCCGAVGAAESHDRAAHAHTVPRSRAPQQSLIQPVCLAVEGNQPHELDLRRRRAKGLDGDAGCRLPGVAVPPG